jgi:hypothetical protein
VQFAINDEMMMIEDEDDAMKVLQSILSFELLY